MTLVSSTAGTFEAVDFGNLDEFDLPSRKVKALELMSLALPHEQRCLGLLHELQTTPILRCIAVVGTCRRVAKTEAFVRQAACREQD